MRLWTWRGVRSFVRDATGGVRAETAVPGKPIAFHGGERADGDDVVGAVADEDGNARNAVGALENLRQNVKDNNTSENAWATLLFNIYKLTGPQARPLRRTCRAVPCCACLPIPKLQSLTVAQAAYNEFARWLEDHKPTIDQHVSPAVCT